MKTQFLAHHSEELHQPIARNRVAYLLRAARSRRSNNLKHYGYRAYLIKDSAFVIFPA